MNVRKWLTTAMMLTSLFMFGCNKCGNGELQLAEGEECDDGNRLNGDGCSAECFSECGDGVEKSNAAANIFEFCDDGNRNNGDGCDENCRLEFDAVNHNCSLPDGFKNQFGGCCNSDDDCDGDIGCLNGICSLAGQCSADSDCQALFDATDDRVNAVPHPAGTVYTCADLGNGGGGFCVAGSGERCEDAQDERCPSGETCTHWIDVTAHTQVGVCTANFLGAADAGEFCEGEGTIYECAGPGLAFALNCFSNTCASMCNPADGALNNAACPSSFECVGIDVDLLGDGQPTPGGYCLPALCGNMELGDIANENIDPDACAAGSTCNGDLVDLFSELLDGLFHQADGVIEMRCAAEAPGGVQDGQPCENDPFFGLTCHDAGLCLQAGAGAPNGQACFVTAECCPQGPQGCDLVCDGAFAPADIAGECAAKPDPGICSSTCASERDCAGLTDPLCADIGFLTVFDPTGGNCQADADCNAGERCEPNPNGGQSRCSPSADIPSCFATADFFDPAVVEGACNAEADCTAPAGCIGNAFGGAGDRTSGGICVDLQGGAAAVGTSCTSPDDCRSGFCFDENFDVVGQSTCSSLCATTADCGTDQICAPVLTNNNDFNGAPGDLDDDTVLGVCFTNLIADVNAACINDATTAGRDSCEVDIAAGSGTDCSANGDADCAAVVGEVCFDDGVASTCRPPLANGGDTCNATTGQCSTSGAGVGDSCLDNNDCNDNQDCIGVNGVTPGFCVLNGCDAIAGTGCGGGETCAANDITGNAPGTCLVACTADAQCIAVNAALTCQDTDDDNVDDACLLP